MKDGKEAGNENKTQEGAVREEREKEKGVLPDECRESCGEERPALPSDNRGIGVVEIILILVILIGLVLLFQTQIKSIVTNALNDISSGAGKIKI